MYLTSTSLVYYLLARGHVTRESVVYRDFRVSQLDGHNRNFRVTRAEDQSLFVKQIKEVDAINVDCLVREAGFYQLVWRDPRLAPLTAIMPAFVDYDPATHVVIIQQIADAENLTQCHRRLGTYPVDVARRLGQALGKLHAAPAHELEESVFPHCVPWSLSLHERDTSPQPAAIRQLVDIVRNDAPLRQQLEALAGGWCSESLIHGDMKWNNCLISPGEQGQPLLHLIDWELVDLGDPLWDVAGALQGYLSEWILLAPLDREFSPKELFHNSADVIGSMQPAMRELWRAYTATCKDRPGKPERAQQCARYMGARLLLTIVESQKQARELNHNCRTMIAFSRWMLSRPQEAAEILLGD